MSLRRLDASTSSSCMLDASSSHLFISSQTRIGIGFDPRCLTDHFFAIKVAWQALRDPSVAALWSRHPYQATAEHGKKAAYSGEIRHSRPGARRGVARRRRRISKTSAGTGERGSMPDASNAFVKIRDPEDLRR